VSTDCTWHSPARAKPPYRKHALHCGICQQSSVGSVISSPGLRATTGGGCCRRTHSKRAMSFGPNPPLWRHGDDRTPDCRQRRSCMRGSLCRTEMLAWHQNYIVARQGACSDVERDDMGFSTVSGSAHLSAGTRNRLASKGFSVRTAQSERSACQTWRDSCQDGSSDSRTMHYFSQFENVQLAVQQLMPPLTCMNAFANDNSCLRKSERTCRNRR
jgi:hypothetical protein